MNGLTTVVVLMLQNEPMEPIEVTAAILSLLRFGKIPAHNIAFEKMRKLDLISQHRTPKFDVKVILDALAYIQEKC